MKITQTLYVPDRKAWRAWLKKHARTEKEIWLIYYRKQAGKLRLPYNDAVEEALCFGWIDSIVKSLDADRLVQRFSPRRPKSGFSQPNKERLRRLIERGQVMPEVLATLGDLDSEAFVYPADILKALKANPQA